MTTNPILSLQSLNFLNYNSSRKFFNFGTYNYDTNNLTYKVFDVSPLGTIDGAILGSERNVTNFSTVLVNEEGAPKLLVAYDGYGHFRLINTDLLEIAGPENIYLDNITSVGGDYGVNTFNYFYSDLIESSKGFTVAQTVTTSSKEFSDEYHIIHNYAETVRGFKIDLNAPQLNEAGEEILNCSNIEEPYGNVTSNVTLIGKGKLMGATDSFFPESTKVDSLYIGAVPSKEPFYSNFQKNQLDDSPKFKHVVVPIKQNINPEDSDNVYPGLIVFDLDLDAFQFRFINNQAEDNDTLYFVHNNGFAEDYTTYNNMKAYGDMTDSTSANEIYVSSFTGFSFSNEVTYTGLRDAASKKWSDSSKRFSQEGNYSVDSSTFKRTYSFLPVAFGNRLMPLSSYEMVNNIGKGLRNGTEFTFGADQTNIGYFNIAYATMHGIILMRLSSYSPVLIPPSNPDGIEIHLPGGKWDYQEEDGSYPFQEAGGFTPISMEFSPDNNFLYAVVAKPDDRTVRYLCVYNLTLLDVDGINSSVQVIKDFETSNLKSLALFKDSIIATSTGYDVRSTTIPDSSSGVRKIANDFLTGSYDFSTCPAKFLESTATEDNTWSPTDKPIPEPGAQTFFSNSLFSSHVLTPAGFLNTVSPLDGLEPSGSYNLNNLTLANIPKWINSFTISDGSLNPKVSVYVEEFEGVLTFNILNNSTNEFLYTKQLFNEYIPETFYDNPQSIGYLPLKEPINSYLIYINYTEMDLFADSALLSDESIKTRDAFAPYWYGLAAMITLEEDNAVSIITDWNLMDQIYGDFTSPLHNSNTTTLFPPIFFGSNPFRNSNEVSAYARTVGHTHFVSLKDDTNAIMQLLSSSGFAHYNVEVDLSQPTPIRLNLVVDPSFEPTIISGYVERKQYIPPGVGSNPAGGATSVLLEPSIFGDGINYDYDRPIHSIVCVTHDATKAAAVFYNENNGFGIHIYKLNQNEEGQAVLEMHINLGILSKLSLEGANYIKNYLDALSSSYRVTAIEFSPNKRNLYLLFTLARGSEVVDGEPRFFILKVDTGDNTDIVSVLDITSSMMEIVGQYHYTSVISESEAYIDLSLPAGVSQDILLNSEIQENTTVTGMFKANDHIIYLLTEFTTRDESISFVPTLGKIINSDQIIGENSYPTKYIKAGIPL